MIARKLTFQIALTALMATALVVAQASVVRAAEEEATTEFGGKAPYFSAGGVFGLENNNSALGTGGVEDKGGAPTSAYGDLSDSGGYDLRGGYNFGHMFAAEIEWQSLLSFSTDATDSITGNNMPAVEARMLSLNGIFTPLTGRFRPYALAGMGWVNVQGDRVSNTIHKSSFGMRFGAGVSVFITHRSGISLEAAYVIPFTGDIGGGERFDFIPITASFFFVFK